MWRPAQTRERVSSHGVGLGRRPGPHARGLYTSGPLFSELALRCLWTLSQARRRRRRAAPVLAHADASSCSSAPLTALLHLHVAGTLSLAMLRSTSAAGLRARLRLPSGRSSSAPSLSTTSDATRSTLSTRALHLSSPINALVPPPPTTARRSSSFLPPSDLKFSEMSPGDRKKARIISRMLVGGFGLVFGGLAWEEYSLRQGPDPIYTEDLYETRIRSARHPWASPCCLFFLIDS